ncbi:Prophage CP4-57 integrase [compost metagenome]
MVIEAQLAHAVKDANGRAYNRTQYVNQRKQMMQRWADYLDALREQNRAIVEPSVQQVRGAKKGESMASLVRNFLHAADPFDTPNVLREGRLEAQEILPAPRTLLNDTERRAQSKKKREGKQSMAELAADAVAAMTHSAAKR